MLYNPHLFLPQNYCALFLKGNMTPIPKRLLKACAQAAMLALMV